MCMFFFFETINITSDFNEKFLLIKLIVFALDVNLEIREWATNVLENKEVFSLDISTGEYVSFFQDVIEL
ncbi:hypothetical protein B9T62_08040 [Paenibacillus donghaensis]|uniref:Uncharacterized protein n=1 Tax=Paenibacillus donghaensis TaxID=414771 RepID=A0A2Z2KCM2_9BACL|nr:hypothetical protein B9T62_08040 [Paenibacillus donghaensis]